MIKFPAPEFVVFYNGDETEPLKREMRLSDAFLADTRSLELVVTAYNINFGLSQPIVGKCKYLHDYSFLVDRVKKGKADGLSTNQAIREAVKYCIEHGIMSDYLNEHAEEVFRMSIDAWDINEAKYYWKEEAREEGIEEGMEKGRNEATGNIILELLKAKQPLAFISQVSKYPIERIAEIGRLNGIPLPN
ncbi:MAG: hypothetical protein J6M62_08180 [Selenomonadaceae bacterium]|nr:hypothetical protein [Selenomonadaceae bacterium]